MTAVAGSGDGRADWGWASRRMPGGSRIGGRWAVSLRVYLVSAPVVIGFFLLTENGALASGQALAQWTVIQVVGYLALGAVLLAADRTVLRNRRTHPVPAWVVVAVGALGGVARAAVMAWLIAWWQVPTTNPVGVRLVMGAFLGAFWLAGVAKINADLEEIRTEYRGLLAAQIEQHRRLAITTRERDELKAALANEVGRELSAAVADGGRPAMSGDDLAALRARLDQLAGPVRDLSHRLWDQQAPTPVANEGQLLKYAMTGNVLRPRLSLLFVTLLGVVALGRTHGWPVAVLISGTYAGSVLLAAEVINRYAAAGPRRTSRQLITVSVVALLLVPLPFVAVMVAAGLPTVSVLTDWFAALMYTLLVIPLASSVLSPMSRRRIAVAALRQQVTEDDLRSIAIAHEQASLCRELARHMHGTVQAELYAASLRLSAGLDAGAGGSWAAHRSAADLATHLVSQLPDGSGRAEAVLAPHLTRLTEQWQGLVEVVLDLDPAVATAPLGPAVCRQVTELLGEVVHDALHHGAASRITVAVSVTEAGVLVRTQDDGVPVATDDVPGLGSALLDEHATSWARVPAPDGSGTFVTFTVAVSALPPLVVSPPAMPPTARPQPKPRSDNS